MLQFIVDNIVAIIFGLATVILSFVTLRLKLSEHKAVASRVVGAGRQVSMFLDRDAMLEEMLSMYDRSKSGDMIWVQCVGCGNYSSRVRTKVLEAAGKGVSFQIIVNSRAPSVGQLRSIFDPINSAEVLGSEDNTIRIQGLSDSEVIIGLPGVDSYTGIRIVDRHIVSLFRNWFDKRVLQVRQEGGVKDGGAIKPRTVLPS
ncbi:MAG: hypothetical protein AAFY55_11450 [Bacteroidota bacterium]